jgi:Flp pilus assembly protein TadB
LESHLFIQSTTEESMRALEIVAALIVAVIAFIAVKLLGLVIHVALIAAVLGLVLGFGIARAFRRT